MLNFGATLWTNTIALNAVASITANASCIKSLSRTG